MCITDYVASLRLGYFNRDGRHGLLMFDIEMGRIRNAVRLSTKTYAGHNSSLRRLICWLVW